VAEPVQPDLAANPGEDHHVNKKQIELDRRLTRRQARQQGSRAGATQSEATQSGRTSLKYVPRPVVEDVLSSLLDHVQHAWERLNDAALSLTPVSEGPPKRPVADPLGDLWQEPDDSVDDEAADDDDR